MHNTLELLTIVIKDGHRGVTEPILDTNIPLICLEVKCETLFVLFGQSVVNNCDVALHMLVSWF